MTTKQFHQIRTAGFVLTLGVAAALVYFSYPLLALATVMPYLIIISLLKARVDGVLIDERQSYVAGKAAQTSFQILVPILFLTSAALLVDARLSDFGYTKAIGIILAYITCLALVIYGVVYWYFNRQTGGQSDDR